MKIWTCGSSPRSGSRNAWTRIKNVDASHLSNFWNFFGEFQMISCRDWWSWTRPGYITMTRRQSNNQWGWRHSGSPRHSKIRSAKIHWKSFSPRSFRIKTALSSVIIFKRAKLSTRSITHLCWCNWRTFWKKNTVGSSPRVSCSCTTMPWFARHLQPRRNCLPGLPMSWSPTLLSVSDPVGLPPVPWTQKTIQRSPFFIRRRGHCCCGHLVGPTTFYISFEWLAEVRATG